jgi:hypothetical protein
MPEVRSGQQTMIPLDSITSLHVTLAMLLSSITPDFINGSFELLAGVFVLNHCRVLHAHKQARGVSLASVLFFTLWGLWNLYYYPSLNQPLSYYGGWFVVGANALYVGMMVSYRSREDLGGEIYLGGGK